MHPHVEQPNVNTLRQSIFAIHNYRPKRALNVVLVCPNGKTRHITSTSVKLGKHQVYQHDSAALLRFSSKLAPTAEGGWGPKMVFKLQIVRFCWLKR